ncbi:MAG: sugar phosphate isomerase/epimerase [Gemmatimonadaceae bacterium]
MSAALGDNVACGRRSVPGGTSTSDTGLSNGGQFPLAAIGLQLYTVRTLMEHNVDQALRQVAAAGYSLVETVDLAGESAEGMRALLDRHGLRSPAGHYALEMLQDTPERVFAAARTLGQEYIVVPSLPEAVRASREQYHDVASRLNAFGEKCQTAGFRFAYHNHDFEFATFGALTPAYDILLERTNPKIVSFELDLYWIYKGGQDPLTYFDRFPGRFPLAHAKDGTAAPEKTMADVGQGVIPFPRIFSASSRAGLRYAFVEHDEPGDPAKSIRSSRSYLSTILS